MTSIYLCSSGSDAVFARGVSSIDATRRDVTQRDATRRDTTWRDSGGELPVVGDALGRRRQRDALRPHEVHLYRLEALL